MKLNYLAGFLAANLFRFLRVFPNSDPIMGFVVPCAKNEKVWKAPLFAFSSMFIFDFFTSGIGIWTIVTATAYAFVAMLLGSWLRGKASSIKGFLSAGALGVLVFDFITGPIMSTFLFKQEFIATLAMQVPFTAMHIISASFFVLLISPLYDPAIAREMSGYFSVAKTAAKSAVKVLGF
ncbi:Uncharacterised protein [uncultured archaeon]|nr:Uncharacterised protein [uncultured archaeon]